MIGKTMMGKSQKVSRGNSSGFIPDYRHAAETIGESEGFGSSGRVDTEMTASDDSCAPKRKCISLNVDTHDGFTVPLEVISLSKMSRSDRKELESRLREELEKVRILRRKIDSKVVNVSMSSCSGIHSDASLKRTKIGSGSKTSHEQSGQGKKSSHGSRNGTYMKRDESGRFEPGNKETSFNNSYAMLVKQCENLLNRVMKHQFGWVFNEPVDVKKLKIPDYFTVIKHPMDLGTVMKKLTSGGYLNLHDFAADVRLTFANAMTYNPPGNDVHIMADTLSKFFEVRWKSIEKKLPSYESQSFPSKSTGIIAEEHSRPIEPQSKTRKIQSVDQNVKHEIPKPKMTMEERQNLSRDLQSLPGDMPDQIIDFLRNLSDNANQTSEDEIEIDIDALDDDTLFKLRKILDNHLSEKHLSTTKAEACEMEILNESGLSNSSLQPVKGNEQAEEDVDIGGNDPPISSYPPVEIEKDTAHKSSKCSSSSSTSSDSGSSSSDSDSASSSGSESEGGKISPQNDVKEEPSKTTTFNQERSDVIDLNDGKWPQGGLDSHEQSSNAKPGSSELEDHQEGENAPSERQVSPGKLYRAALLRNRFADTILKAQEKTLDKKVEKGDPGKLRREREELERKQREEKARLQAEAKAAEDARRQAEMAAAAEAKRKREQEREAARQALQKMEKTVEINGGSEFLKDLEMFGSAHADSLLDSIHDTSPHPSLEEVGGFKLQRINTLEKLGLYMKIDEEEEEEEGGPVSAPVNDVEEGEID